MRGQQTIYRNIKLILFSETVSFSQKRWQFFNESLGKQSYAWFTFYYKAHTQADTHSHTQYFLSLRCQEQICPSFSFFFLGCAQWECIIQIDLCYSSKMIVAQSAMK